MIWDSKGLLFSPKKISWVKTHAWVPTVYKYKKDMARVFFAGRDKSNHSNVGAFNVSLKPPYKIFGLSKSPVLNKGRLGCFDDCAAIPCHVIKVKNTYYMYYVGWTQGLRVPYMSSIGLAKSKNLFGKFKRVSEAPIFGRSKEEPIFVASCFVEKLKRKFIMYYTSNKKWKKINKKIVPKYYLRLAQSKNGLDWKYKSEVMKFKSKEEIAISRPWIVKAEGKKIMFYSYRGKNYKIGCASINKKKFLFRKDKKVKISNKIDKFDNIMREYASIVKFKTKYLMFYNGNNFGEKGIGLAIIDQKNFKI